MRNTLKVLLSFLMVVSVVLPNLSLAVKAEEGEEITTEETMPTTNEPYYPNDQRHEYENNDDAYVADWVDDYEGVLGEIGSYNYYLEREMEDTDFFRTLMYKGNTYTITFNDYQSEFKNTTLKIDLLDSDGNVVLNISDQLKKNKTNSVTFTSTSNNCYYIKLYNYVDYATHGDHYYTITMEANKVVTYWDWDYTTGKDFFVENNKMVTNAWREIGDEWYYFDGNGAPKTNSWLKYGNSWYYFNEYSTMVVGQQQIKGVYYVFDEEGRMITGWKKIYGFWYYADSNGKAKVNSWLKYKDHWYYFNEWSEMVTGPEFVKEVLYVFDEEGRMITGWKQVYGTWFYADSTGKAKLNCWFKYKNNWYYFGEWGQMYEGPQYVNGVLYVFDENGKMITGWKKVYGYWFYADSTGKAKTGWIKSGNSWYYLDPEWGYMYAGYRFEDEKGNTYCVKDSGAMVTGWYKDGSDWYYYKSSGIMATGWLKYGNSWYYLDPSWGNMYSDTWLNDNGNIYYLAAGGEMLTGLQQIDGDYYYFKSSGIMASNENVTINGTVYYIGYDGRWIADFD